MLRGMMKTPCLLVLMATLAQAETGYNAWLRYAPLAPEALSRERASLPAVIFVSGDSPLGTAARDEIVRGVRGMLGRNLRIETVASKEPAILIGTFRDLNITADAPPDSYLLRTI